MQIIRHVTERCWQVLADIADPEIPVLSILDLGMIRGVDLNADHEIIVRLTPTYSIAPPQGDAAHCGTHVALQDGISCPQCASSATKLLSEFGSTACKALYQCQNCLEPFDYFKCI